MVLGPTSCGWSTPAGCRGRSPRTSRSPLRSSCTAAAYRSGWTCTATAPTAAPPPPPPGSFAAPAGPRDRLAAADVALSVCPGETFGLAVLEALACGTPVVTADRGGARELVDATSGDWGTPDPSSLADAVLRLAARPEDVVRRAARHRAEGFGWDRTVARMLALHAGDHVGVLTA